MIEIIKTEFPDLYVLKPKVLGDARGYFFESYHLKQLESAGIRTHFVQDNESHSRKGTIRGMHFQRGEFAQSKLLRVVHGHVLDVVVDLRAHSPTFKRTLAIELSSENHAQILVPRGMAHGFSVLSDSATIVYKCDNYYSHPNECGINPEDPDLNIDWQVPKEQRILSDKDKRSPSLKAVLANRDWESK